MEQRLNITIKDGAKILANSHCVWDIPNKHYVNFEDVAMEFGYTIIDYIKRNKEWSMIEDDVKKAIILLEATGGGLLESEFTNNYPKEEFRNHGTKLGGLITISKQAISEHIELSKHSVNLDIKNKTIDISSIFKDLDNVELDDFKEIFNNYISSKDRSELEDKIDEMLLDM